MTINKKHIINILFFCFIIFLFTPYGLNTRSKLTQGVLFLKGMVISPSGNEIANRVVVSDNNVSFNSLVNAKNISLKSLKGKVVFINHWATWCPPCRAEMPSLDNLYRDYADKIEFIFLTTDPKKAIVDYYAANDFSFPTYAANSSLPKEINTTTLPATFILDKEGNLFLEEFGPADWNSSKIRAMLDELLTQ